jgi:hypothetical protein
VKANFNLGSYDEALKNVTAADKVLNEFKDDNVKNEAQNVVNAFRFKIQIE